MNKKTTQSRPTGRGGTQKKKTHRRKKFFFETRRFQAIVIFLTVLTRFAMEVYDRQAASRVLKRDKESATDKSR